jgi:transcriptional repressor NrdR
VIDSRPSDEATAIRRRRCCPECSHRFTTYERLDDVPLSVSKRSGERVLFSRTKVASGVAAACKGRAVTEDAIDLLAEEVEEEMRRMAVGGREITTSDVGRAVLERLRAIDEVAYLRFASVYKNFDAAADFSRELALLKQP